MASSLYFYNVVLIDSNIIKLAYKTANLTLFYPNS